MLLLMPQLFIRLWQRTFYPELRDLAMETNYLKLGDEHLRLRRWNIPPAQRKLPLRKGAPHDDDPEAGVLRWISMLNKLNSCRGKGV